MSDELENELEDILAGEIEPEDRTDVRTVVGSTFIEFEVYTTAEEAWFNNMLQRYLDEYHFDNVSDLQDLDRLVAMELISNRYMHWLLKGTDYWEQQFDERAARDHKQKVDQEIRLLKKQMGMDRKNRLESEAENVADYLTNLRRRAKEFGIHRDMQIAKAMDLWMELKKLVNLYDRTDEEERRHLGVDMVQIFDWIRDVGIPEYDKIDDAFRKNQRLWIKEVN